MAALIPATPNTIELGVEETAGNGLLVSTVHEDWDSSGYPQKRGGDLLCTEDETFLPAFGRYVRDLARKYPNATITVKLI